jgi:hypothetical protein
MNNLREPDDESTTYVSAQPGAPLPPDFSEDTIVVAHIPATTDDSSPAASTISELTEVVRRTGGKESVEEHEVVDEATIVVRPNNGVADETIVTRASPKELEDFTEHTITADSPSDDGVVSGGDTALPAATPAPVSNNSAAAHVEVSEPEVDREILKSFDPLADNEKLRVQGIREANTITDISSVRAPRRPDNAQLKTPKTAEQLFKKNQARRQQQRLYLMVFMGIMAAVGVLAAIVVGSIISL